MVSARSAAFATWYGLPLSSDSSCANSSACFSMRSASLFIKTPRSAALILRHGPLSNAARAAATALSTSAASDSATCVITLPVDGLIVGNVFPDTLSTHLPLISNFVGPTLTFFSNTAAAVAILISSSICVSALPGRCSGRLLRRAPFLLYRGRPSERLFAARLPGRCRASPFILSHQPKGKPSMTQTPCGQEPIPPCAERQGRPPNSQCAGAGSSRTSLNCLIFGEARKSAPKRAFPCGSRLETLS